MSDTPTPPVELMYKPPGMQEHINITEALDEIILTLRELEERVHVIEEWCDSVASIAHIYNDEDDIIPLGGTD